MHDSGENKINGVVGQLNYDTYSGEEKTYENGIPVGVHKLTVDENGWRIDYTETYRDGKTYIEEYKDKLEKKEGFHHEQYEEREGFIEDGIFTGRQRKSVTYLAEKKELSEEVVEIGKGEIVYEEKKVHELENFYHKVAKTHMDGGKISISETIENYNGPCQASTDGVVWDEWQQKNGKKNGVEYIHVDDDEDKFSVVKHWKNGELLSEKKMNFGVSQDITEAKKRVMSHLKERHPNMTEEAIKNEAKIRHMEGNIRTSKLIGKDITD